jgi:ATP-dependent DNA helicase RecG
LQTWEDLSIFAGGKSEIIMTIQEIKKLRETEDKIEFKEAKAQFSYNSGRKSVLGYVSALANEGGGYLILGVRESAPHEICGSPAFEGREGKLEQDVYRDLKIRIRTQTLYEEANRVLVIEIPSRPIGKLIYFEDVPLMRVGESLTKMSDEEIFRILSENEPDFSATICKGLIFEDLDTEAIRLMKAGYAKKQKNSAFETLPDLQVLGDLGLMINGKLNYAALILLGKREALREYLNNAEVIIEYRLNHSMIPYTARKEFQESLFTVMDKVWAYINQPASNPLLHVRHKFTIYDIPAFNEDVIREAVLNAIGHRLWRDLSSVVIKQYPDSISIINSGGFPDGVTKSNILTVSSKPRNKLVMEVLEKTGQVERAGQGVDKMYYNCLMEGKPLPDYSHTDNYQVDLCLRAKIVDEAFYIFVNEIQDRRKEEDKLNVFDLLTLDKVRQGISTGLYEASVEKLQREGLIQSQSSADKKYVLGNLYYEITKQPAYIKEYRVKDLQIVAGCFEKAKEVYMKDFVDAFNNQLSRGQIKFLILKLETDKLLTKIKAQKYTHYILNKETINIQRNIYEQFIEKLSE